MRNPASFSCGAHVRCLLVLLPLLALFHVGFATGDSVDNQALSSQAEEQPKSSGIQTATAATPLVTTSVGITLPEALAAPASAPAAPPLASAAVSTSSVDATVDATTDWNGILLQSDQF